MKKYLVSYITNYTVTKAGTVIIETDDSYCPADDNMKLLKEKIIKENNPRHTKIYASPNGGYLSAIKYDPIPAYELDILAVSNLNV